VSAAELASDLKAAVGAAATAAPASLADLIRRWFPNMASTPDAHVREDWQAPTDTPTTVVVTRSRRNTVTAPRASIAAPPVADAAGKRKRAGAGSILLFAVAALSVIVWWIVIMQAR